MVGRVDRPPRMTADTFFTLPEDNSHCELIDGELRVAPAPRADIHQHTVRELFRPLDYHVHSHHLGWVWFAPVDVVLSAQDVVQPDLIFVKQDRADIVGGRIYGAPDLVVEVLSPDSERGDRGTKLHRYARSGIRRYWITDPVAQTLDELELIQGAYVCRQHLEGSPSFAPSLFPGLTIALADIWPVVRSETSETSDE